MSDRFDDDYDQTMAEIRRDFDAHFPTIEYSSADCAWYWKSLEKHEPGDELWDHGRRFIVQWCDPWWTPGDIVVYISGMELKND